MKVTKMPVNTRELSSKRTSTINNGINNVFLNLMNYFDKKELLYGSIFKLISDGFFFV
jgi:hypothetical protein